MAGNEEAEISYDPDDEAARGSVSKIEAVRAAHEDSLLAIAGVEGVGTGRSEIGEAVITVYVRDASVGKRLPKRLDGFEVRTVVTGAIDALR